MNKNKVAFLVITCVMLFFILMIGPFDVFSHGFYCDTTEYDQIDNKDFLEDIDLGEKDSKSEFMPLKRHFKGFMIYLTNMPEENQGTLDMTIYDESMKVVEEIAVAINDIPSEEWYRVYMDRNLQANKTYVLNISAKNCQKAPHLKAVDADYLSEENISGNVLLGYAYAKSTFSFPEKVLISMFLIAGWIVLYWRFGKKKVPDSKLIYGAAFIFMTAVLAWNYMYNSMDNQNSKFDDFQADSETLVSGVIEAERNNVPLDRYGLGWYMNSLGEKNNYNLSFVSDDNWTNGYSNTEPKILISNNAYTFGAAVVGNYVKFSNGEMIKITNVEVSGNYLIISMKKKQKLLNRKYGDLSEIRFFTGDKEQIAKGQLKVYRSQFGLQGKIFRHLARRMNDEEVITNLNFLCSIATAIVFVLITFLLFYKYNFLFAACFYITFWLSPWVVNFARNLYWVEFTWFLPMLIGLFCSLKIKEKKCRIFSYVAAFFVILGRCLCGYEYISVIMMGMIAFLMVDFIMACILKDSSKKKGLLFKTIFIMGIMALLGFLAAILIHANLRGGGDIAAGVKSIIEQDVLKRVNGGDLNNFDEVFWPSFNASIWEVVCKYFHFSTEIITGVTGNLFPLLCTVPLGIYVYNFKRNELNWELPVMYAFFFLTAILWYILAKSHSYIHTHINFVLWYFGFIQICIYTICSQIKNIIVKKKGD